MAGFSRVAVIGAGLMGPGIAQVFAQSGFQVSLVSRSEDSLSRAKTKLQANLDLFVACGRTTHNAAQATSERVTFGTNLGEGVADADFIVETISEDLEAKRRLFAELGRLATRSAVLATNTSGLAIRDIARDAAEPERTLTAHFWNPPHLLPIVEVVGNDVTPPDTIDVTVALLRQVGKEPVVLRRDVRGFIGNRLQYALLREALSLVQSGVASAEDVDQVVKRSFGRRLSTVGPLETCDLGGLDLAFHISSYLFRDLDASVDAPPILREHFERGELGAKTGRGLHDWPANSAAETLRRRDAELLRWHLLDVDGQEPGNLREAS
ncbi:MAG TPA: 3-hydroxyacyl-CoA dehydrogenase NAD-binding domain-containing protein, partial [Chloroflexota bacterium]|nr:3-hydroxyacyl-CoA dehydrogenase NAD-binding domain-containing protein [Chloroflexota bacterium]